MKSSLVFHFISILLFCSVSLLQAQRNARIDVSQQITWSNPCDIMLRGKEVKVLNINGQDNYSEETGLPYVVQTFAVPNSIDLSTIDIQLVPEGFKWPTPEEYIIGKESVLFNIIPCDYWIDNDKGVCSLNVKITPLMSGDTESSFKKLTKYNLAIFYDEKELGVLKSVSESKYTNTSVLAEGDWVKVRADKTGVYRIPYSSLEGWGFDDPEKVSVYGNGGKLLPESNSESRYDDLQKNAIWHYNDALYFFVEGPTTWEYDSSLDMFVHTNHNYSDYAYYFLTDKDEDVNNIKASGLQQGESLEIVSYFNDYQLIEDEQYNLLSSGREWLGDRFNSTGSLSRSYSFSFDNVITDNEADVYVKVVARSTTLSSFSLTYNDEQISKRTVARITSGDNTGYYARQQKLNTSFYPVSDNLSFTLDYDGESSSIGYLDYFEINVDRQLALVDNQLCFRNADFVEDGKFVSYQINNTSSNTQVWDVTEPVNAQLVDVVNDGASLNFIYDASDLKEFIVFNPDESLYSVEYVDEVENQNIHGEEAVDYLIVTNETFLDQAERLAQLHQNYYGISTLVVTQEQVFNEFSSGQPDVCAIRDLAKMFYDRAETEEDMPKYMLLFGDGSYDNKSESDNTNQIITYESEESLHQSYSYVSDDFFCFLDDDEGENLKNEKMDMGIGRFPVNTYDEATVAVDKSESYLYDQTNSIWKTNLTFVADDGNASDDISNIHMSDAEEISSSIEEYYPEFNINKVYFDAYTRQTTSTGYRYPDVEDEIYKALHNGTLIFNYTGHGGEEGLGHEHVVSKNLINSWTNINKLAIFMTATCEFSRYDNNDETSAGEMVFLNSLGGGIALFTTTRVVYSSQNKKINTSFYNNVFTKDDDGNNLSFGEIFRLTKNETAASVNKLNFTLLGDPGLHPIYPDLDAITASINDQAVGEVPDTLKALSQNTIEGYIAEELYLDTEDDILDTLKIEDYDGELYVTVYDKPETVVTNGNVGNEPFEFTTYTSKIFYGRSTVSGGEFSSEFVVPKDIRYNYDVGKISYYANNGEEEAFGAFNNIVVGGISTDAGSDIDGPQLEVYLNNRNFKSGDETTPAPTLLVDLFDENGINTTGAGIGHDIIGVLDGNTSDQITLNSYYTGALDDYQTGYVEYQMSEMETGEHTLKIKAWDIYNNSTETEITFYVNANSSVVMSDAKFYKNPISGGETGYFYFTHDEPNVTMDVGIKVYTLDGKVVSSMSTTVVSLEETISPIEWVASGANGSPLKAGIYIYQIMVTSDTGRKGKVSGKILVTP